MKRDLKPSNVLCVNGQVKVLDFGIAIAAGNHENIAGTLDYMAPELLTGQPPSVASDLYAVGILAYQMITGSHPHDQKSQTGFLRSIFNTSSDITLSGEVAQLLDGYSHTFSGDMGPGGGGSGVDLEELTGPIGEVVQRLLSPKPADRYADAGAVVQALAAATGESILLETAATRESFLQASQMVGRQAELDQLSTALERTLKSVGSAWLLGGESGVGKSRLMSEVRTLAMVSGAVVAQGQAVAENSSHYILWLPVLRILCLHAELTDADAAVLKVLIPDLANLLGRPVPDAPKVQPEFAEKRLFAVIESLFTRRTRPLVVLLEDLQWAGADSLALLNRLTEIAHELPLQLVGTYRDDEDPKLPLRLPHMQLLRLRRLTADSIAQLSASMLGEVGKQSWVVEYLLRQTEGNVFFLVEVARALAEQAGELADLASSSLPEQVFTLGIGRLVERRLDHVPASYRPVLEAAAIIGRKLDLAVLGHLFPSFDLRTFLMACANAAILESSESDWRFVHDKLREGLLDGLSLEQRQGLHAKVAGALEAIYADVESYSAILAYHFQQASIPEKASQYFLRAGESATRLCAYNDARRHFAGALATLQQLPESDENKRRKVDTLLKQVRAASIADNPKVNLERLELATTLLKSLATAGQADVDVLRLAWVVFWFGRIHYLSDDSRESLLDHQQVLRVAKEHNYSELLMLASSASGTALFAQGRVDLALPLLNSTLATFAAMGHGYEWVRAVGHHGLCLVGLGQYERGLADLERAHARALEIDQPIIISMTHMYYCVASMHSGDWPVMRSRGHKCLDAAKQCGEKIYQAFGLGFLTWAENQLGDQDQALQHYQSHQEIIQVMGGQLLFSLLFEAVNAEILLNLGRLDEAIKRAQEVVIASPLDDNYNSLGIAERVWGIAVHRRDPGSIAEVDRHFQASLAAFATGWLVLDVARTRLCWAVIYRERGDLVQARQLLAQAILQFMASGCTYALDGAQQLARSWELPS